MDNISKCIFGYGTTYGMATPVTQWDVGITLEVSNIEDVSDQVVEVHFAHDALYQEETLNGIGAFVNGTLTVHIPNAILEEPTAILAYAYLVTEDYAKTMYTIKIPVTPRVKPGELFFDEEEGLTALQVVIDTLNAVIIESGAISEELLTQYNRLVAATTVDSEVILARGGFTTLDGRLDELNTNLATETTNRQTADNTINYLLNAHVVQQATTANMGHVMLSDSSAVTDSTGLALPATEKNASIEGTLAYKQEQLNTSLAWKSTTHSAWSASSIGEGSVALATIPGIIGAKEILIDFNNQRINNLLIKNLNSGGRGISTYITSSAYALCVQVNVNFTTGYIAITVPANTWGFATIPVSVAANSIKYR